MAIHGQERKKLKKELSDLKRYTKMFWHFEDICRAYGDGSSDTECADLLDKANARIKELEVILSE